MLHVNCTSKSNDFFLFTEFGGDTGERNHTGVRCAVLQLAWHAVHLTPVCSPARVKIITIGKTGADVWIVPFNSIMQSAPPETQFIIIEFRNCLIKFPSQMRSLSELNQLQVFHMLSDGPFKTVKIKPVSKSFLREPGIWARRGRVFFLRAASWSS